LKTCYGLVDETIGDARLAGQFPAKTAIPQTEELAPFELEKQARGDA
jgi:hypothetical protein